MDELLKKLETFAYTEAQRTGAPIKMHIDFATTKGIELAKQLNANTDIVKAGTLMMDCLLGTAIKQGRLKDHVKMSYEKTEEILSDFDNISQKDKENILQCVAQHHGADKFYSLESEICCNADCYRFVSMKGFIISIRYLREMPFDSLIDLMSHKVNEKWNALTLDMCKKELEPQYNIIQKILKDLK